MVLERAIVLLTAFCGALAAAEAGAQGGDRFQLGVGAASLHGPRNRMVSLQGEYRAGRHLWLVQPMAGAWINGDEGAYVYAGIFKDFSLGERWIFSPNFAAGLFRAGRENTLGGPLEFQTGLDLYLQSGRQRTFGVSLRHTSNAGIYEPNPGTETLTLYYSWPLD
jgi:hypothetical protein